MRLNVGCGSQPLPGWVNLDIAWQEGVDVVHDLDVAPWPFPPSVAEEVQAFDVFEHVDKPLLFMAECWRILIPAGTLYIHTSWWQGSNSYTDPTHKRFCTESTFDYWIKGSGYWQRYGKAYGGHDHPFELVDREVIANSELAVTLRKLPS